MKSDYWFSRNRLLSQLRIASGVTLISAAAAMAFVAATNTVLNNSSSKSPRRPPFADKLSAEDLAAAFGEPGDGRHGDDVTPTDSEQVNVFAAAEQDYLHRAYPAAEVSIKDT